MRHYEIMIILDPNLEERSVQPSLDQFLKVVTAGGGKVEKTDIWGKRRLAYPIEKKPEGYYAVVDLTAEPGVVLEMDRGGERRIPLAEVKDARLAFHW